MSTAPSLYPSLYLSRLYLLSPLFCWPLPEELFPVLFPELFFRLLFAPPSSLGTCRPIQGASVRVLSA